MPADGESWRKGDDKEDNKDFGGEWFTGSFTVVDGGKCRFIPLVNTDRKYWEDNCFWISAWEIFGSLVEQINDSSGVAFHPNLSTRDVRGPRRRVTTVGYRQTFWRCLLRRGFNLVTAVTRKSTTSPSHLRHPSVIVQRLQ
jgi:hypothetical protein